MSIKDEVLRRLEDGDGATISGEALAKELCVSRNAVFKAVSSLRADGYDVLSSHGGYSLSPQSVALSTHGIKKYLSDERFDVSVFGEVDSTNTVVKDMAERGGREWSVVVAEKQSAGRGRLGRTFLSPRGTGVYFSLLLRPRLPVEQTLKITVAAAVAARRSIEKNSGKRAEIKWVNDIYVGGRKVCGILTEASIDAELSSLRYAVVGVGINISEPQGGFDGEIKNVAGAISETATGSLRARVIADFLCEFAHIYDAGLEGCIDEYRSCQYLDGKDIIVLQGDEKKSAKALFVDENCRLFVRFDDGTEDSLGSGEVSTKIKT